MTNYTKQSRPISPKTARFGSGQFGKAKFGTSDEFEKSARPTDTFSKIERPNFGAMADFAKADIAIIGTQDGYTKIERPE